MGTIKKIKLLVTDFIRKQSIQKDHHGGERSKGRKTNWRETTSN